MSSSDSVSGSVEVIFVCIWDENYPSHSFLKTCIKFSWCGGRSPKKVTGGRVEVRIPSEIGEWARRNKRKY